MGGRLPLARLDGRAQGSRARQRPADHRVRGCLGEGLREERDLGERARVEGQLVERGLALPRGVVEALADGRGGALQRFAFARSVAQVGQAARGLGGVGSRGQEAQVIGEALRALATGLEERRLGLREVRRDLHRVAPVGALVDVLLRRGEAFAPRRRHTGCAIRAVVRARSHERPRARAAEEARRGQRRQRGQRDRSEGAPRHGLASFGQKLHSVGAVAPSSAM
jgi:hypothetical protein